MGTLLVPAVFVVFVIIVFFKSVVIVPQQMAYVVERLGKFNDTKGAGLHILLPFLDRIRRRLPLQEFAMDVPEQICITKDNVQVAVDGILYFKIMSAERAVYGIYDYQFALTQLCQTALRSEIGKIDLDKTFEERTQINAMVVSELDKASEPWGVKVLRYEIKNITPPREVLSAMEKQMRAAREKRAVVLQSEGERDANVNVAEGAKQQVIKASEATKQQQINIAIGQAEAIVAVAKATATGLQLVADVMKQPGGAEAMQLRIAEQYVSQLGHIAKESTSLILPASLTDVASMIATATNVIKKTYSKAETSCEIPENASDGNN